MNLGVQAELVALVVAEGEQASLLGEQKRAIASGEHVAELILEGERQLGRLQALVLVAVAQLAILATSPREHSVVRRQHDDVRVAARDSFHFQALLFEKRMLDRHEHVLGIAFGIRCVVLVAAAAAATAQRGRVEAQAAVLIGARDEEIALVGHEARDLLAARDLLDRDAAVERVDLLGRAQTRHSLAVAELGIGQIARAARHAPRVHLLLDRDDGVVRRTHGDLQRRILAAKCVHYFGQYFAAAPHVHLAQLGRYDRVLHVACRLVVLARLRAARRLVVLQRAHIGTAL